MSYDVTTGFNSLFGASSTGPGFVAKFTSAMRVVAMQVVLTGGPTAAIVNLELSMDGVNWYAGGKFDVAGQNNFSGEFVTVADVPCLYARANLTSLSGGTSPTVTATILAFP